jgi:hypothetical protein
MESVLLGSRVFSWCALFKTLSWQGNHGLDARDLRESGDRVEPAWKLITLLHQIPSLDVLQQLK